MNITTEICNSFNTHAKEYEASAIVQKEIGLRLFARLDYLKINPKYVLDLGCGSGFFLEQLKKRYPDAVVVGLDIAFMMLKEANENVLVNGDMVKMPFSNGVFDLVFANQVIHWTNSFSLLMQEIKRVMNVDSYFMFSTLGIDTFCELKTAWLHVDNYSHINDFIDMHNLGDILLNEQFVDPVVDMEKIIIKYASAAKMLNSLKAQGVRNINSKRKQGLTTKKSLLIFKQKLAELAAADGKISLTYEVIYGHALKGGFRESFIPISGLRKSNNPV